MHIDTIRYYAIRLQAAQRGMAAISSINRRMQCFAVGHEWQIAFELSAQLGVTHI